MGARFEALSSRLEVGFADVPEDEGMSEIDEAVAAERSGKK